MFFPFKVSNILSVCFFEFYAVVCCCCFLLLLMLVDKFNC